MATSDSIEKQKMASANTGRITVIDALEMALDDLGWHGCGERDREIFYCEFCKASHEDYTLIPHHAGCKVTILRSVLLEARGDEREILFELWDAVNALGGHRPTERNYDQGYVDAIGDVLAEIEKAQAASAKLADKAYEIADAMLKVREVKNV